MNHDVATTTIRHDPRLVVPTETVPVDAHADAVDASIASDPLDSTTATAVDDCCCCRWMVVVVVVVVNKCDRVSTRSRPCHAFVLDGATTESKLP